MLYQKRRIKINSLPDQTLSFLGAQRPPTNGGQKPKFFSVWSGSPPAGTFVTAGA
jgi:hypothetical protein